MTLTPQEAIELALVRLEESSDHLANTIQTCHASDLEIHIALNAVNSKIKDIRHKLEVK